jgi:hypothetical protein
MADPVNSSDEAIEAATQAVETSIRRFARQAPLGRLLPDGSIGWGASPMEIAEAALSAAEPIIAARVRAEAVAERDAKCHERIAAMADEFAQIEAVRDREHREAVAAERQRIASVLNASDLFAADAPYSEAAWQLRADLATGSVPVATPEPAVGPNAAWARRQPLAGPVATPTHPEGLEGLEQAIAERRADPAFAARLAARAAADRSILDALAASPVATPTEPGDGAWIGREFERSRERRQHQPDAARLVVTKPPVSQSLSAASPVPAEQPPTFEQLLTDPLEQFDRRSELLPLILHYLAQPDPPDGAREALLRSIEEYRNAPPATASTSHMIRPAEQPAEAVYVTPGHPTLEAAGYDCGCGQCLHARRSPAEQPEE